MSSMSKPLKPDLYERLGAPFLAYVCNASVEEIRKRASGSSRLNQSSESVLGEVLHLANEVLESRGFVNDGGGEIVESPTDALARLCSFVDSLGMGIATSLRVRAGGRFESLPDDDPGLRAVLSMARDYYPALLLPRGERSAFDSMPFPFTRAALDFKHPGVSEFVDALDKGDPLRGYFEDGPISETASARTTITRSGRGGALNAGFLPNTFLMNGEQRAWLGGSISLSSYLAAVAEEVRAARRLVAEEEVAVRVAVGLGPIELAEGIRIATPWGVFRSPNAWEARWAPSRAGAILEVTFPMAIYFWNFGDPIPAAAQAGLLDPMRSLEEAVDRMRFALAIGLERERPIAIAPLWHFIPDPLVMPGFRPFSSAPAMTRNEMDMSDEPLLRPWMDLVQRHVDPSLDLPIRRLLSALSSRDKPEDGLVDAMIALESLFGTGQGEITFRLSVALAWLLGKDGDDRNAKQKEIAVLYGLRSKVVHGGRLTYQEAADAQLAAVSRTVEAFRTLFADYPELIADTNRGRRLAIFGNPDEGSG
jgi:hypothetical protein